MPFVALAKKGLVTRAVTTPITSIPDMHYAYILESVPHPGKLYYGSTGDVKKRVAVHNAGGNVSAKISRPWQLVWYAGFSAREAALDFERYLKSSSGKVFARKRLIPDRCR